ncbi:MAG TPA: Spy/CpxP family protein refolding chaperone [Candidatus Acidoferrales bacterium]|nr:Spy/CpxP family protein refolding chaperone [Candidatus Acidoferrales bacterium]
MTLFKHPAVRAVAAATLVGAFVLAGSLPAAAGTFTQAAKQAPAREILAQAASSQATSAAPAPEESASTAAKANAAVDAHVEARIKAMRKKLHVTSAQETQWNAVAEVMRDNAHSIANLREEGTEQSKSMTAIDQLNSFAAITDAQAAGIRKFIPPFKALYDTMSDAQKKTADELFRSRARAAAKRHK